MIQLNHLNRVSYIHDEERGIIPPDYFRDSPLSPAKAVSSTTGLKKMRSQKIDNHRYRLQRIRSANDIRPI